MKKNPEWLEQKLNNSIYQKIAELYYKDNHPLSRLYIEIEKDGTIRAYDGWKYKRGLTTGNNHIRMSEFFRTQVDKDRLRAELASIICFAKRARKQYGWNVIPVFEGYELI